jgi:hypothetical protein
MRGKMQNGSPAKTAAKWLDSGVVMGIAMRMLCFAVVQGNPGIVAPSIQDTSVNVITTWDQVRREAVHIEKQAVEVYDNVRFAYLVARRLNELQEEQKAGYLNVSTTIRLVKRSGAESIEQPKPQRPRCYAAGRPGPTYSSTSAHNPTVS